MSYGVQGGGVTGVAADDRSAAYVINTGDGTSETRIIVEAAHLGIDFSGRSRSPAVARNAKDLVSPVGHQDVGIDHDPDSSAELGQELCGVCDGRRRGHARDSA